MQIEHPVPDFDGWKQAFESDPIKRKEGGVRRYRILRPIDDPDLAMVDLEFDSLSEAEAFRAALLELWGGAEAKGIIANPKAQIVEVVESKEY